MFPAACTDAARRESRTNYAGLSAESAAQLARQTFPTLVTGPSAGKLSSGKAADYYIDRFTAGVKGAAPDGGDAVVVSSTPLRAKKADGKLAPVDVTLKRVGDGWTATNPLEQYRIGARADDGVTFPGLGLAVRPVEAPADGEEIGKTVFFADSLTDTDTMVKPLTSGVQFAWQLRSADAPERLSLDVQLPAGASLGRPERDGVRVVKDGQTVGRLGVVTAFDADGKIVPTRLEVNGTRITIVVEHVDKDLTYPIAVDPDFVAGFYFSSYPMDTFNYWGSYNPGGKYHIFGGDFWYGRGLYIQSRNYPQEPTPDVYIGGGPGGVDRAGFYFNAPGNAHIWKAYSAVSRHILGASLAHCMIVGIAGPDLNYWEGPYGTTYGEGCAPFNQFSWNLSTPGQGGTASNAFIFGNYAYSNNQVAVDSYLGDVELWMSDPDAPHGPPGFAGPMVMAPAVYPAWITNPDDPISANAKDGSSGVASITFYGPASWTYNGMNGASGITINNPACAYGVCSQDFTAALPIGNMPDGHQVIWAYARDASGQWSPASYLYDMNFDLRPPPAPDSVTVSNLDTASATAELSVMLGEDDPDVGGGDSPASPYATVQVRWRHPGATFTAWQNVEDGQFSVSNAYLGNFVEVEARTVDTANHYSAVLSSSVEIVQPDMGLISEVQAPAGSGSSDVTVDFDQTLDGSTYEAGPGLRVALVRDATGEVILDDTDQDGVASFPDREAGTYTLWRAGTPTEPDAWSLGEAFNVPAGQPVARAASVANHGGNTPQSIAILATLPVALVYTWREDANQAVAATNALFGQDPDGYRPNSFRHSLWVALMTRSIHTYWAPFVSIDPMRAEEYADAREAGGSGSHHDMDLHNNHVGGLFAREHPKRNERQLCLAMRSANLGGRLGASGATARQLYWIFPTSPPLKPGAKSQCSAL